MDDSLVVNEDDDASHNAVKIFVALIVAVLTLALFVFYFRKRTSRDSVLLTGLSGSGKTLLFAQITQNCHVRTFTSFEENIGRYLMTNNKQLRLIDIPGHERIRTTFFDQYKSSAKGIVFVIDSQAVLKNICDVADFLYIILTDPDVSKSRPKFFIWCNKQDLSMSKDSSVIKLMLEKELNTLRITRSNQLDIVAENTKKKPQNFGNLDKNFEFRDLKLSIEFGEGCAYGTNSDDSIDIDHFNVWLKNIA